MSYSLTTFFVVPVGNTLPTTGSTENLTDKQVGVFKDDARTVATVGNISTAEFIQIAEGRPSTLYVGTKVSDKIKSTKVKKKWKIFGQGTASVQITEMSNFSGKCDEDLTVSFRLHSSYADTISFNGITQNVTVKLPCCDCGADPCETIDNETIIDLILAKIAQIDAQLGVDPAGIRITTFLSFNKTGTGDDAVLVVSGKPLTVYGNPCDLAAFPFEYDRMWFRAFAHTGPDTTVDFLAFDRCDSVADIVVTQRASFPIGTSDEVEQNEIDYNSYQQIHKHLFRQPGYNQYFSSNVTAGTVYDYYWIQFDELVQDDSWTANQKQDERVGIAVPTGTQSATLNTLLVTYFGSEFEDKTDSIPATTTSTTTTTTSTSTTTTLTP
jgi:hypothetical protein